RIVEDGVEVFEGLAGRGVREEVLDEGGEEVLGVLLPFPSWRPRGRRRLGVARRRLGRRAADDDALAGMARGSVAEARLVAPGREALGDEHVAVDGPAELAEIDRDAAALLVEEGEVGGAEVAARRRHDPERRPRVRDAREGEDGDVERVLALARGVGGARATVLGHAGERLRRARAEDRDAADPFEEAGARRALADGEDAYVDAIGAAHGIAADEAGLEPLAERVEDQRAAVRVEPEVDHDVPGELEEDAPAPVGRIEERELGLEVLHALDVDGVMPGERLGRAVAWHLDAELGEDVEHEARAIAPAAVPAPAVGLGEVRERAREEGAAREGR